MDKNIFTEDFWTEQWNNVKQSKDTKNNDTYKVHKGFATPEYWDKASLSYDTKNEEIASRKINKIIKLLQSNNLIFENCSVLEIGCGTGLLARELARNKCHVTALDFSQGMIDRCKRNLPDELKDRIVFMHEDWNKIDLEEFKWEKRFDLVAAFMSPAISTPESFFKMMETSKNGCVIKGWATKRKHDILDGLWGKIMAHPLEDKPQNFLYKLNLLFSMGYFPELTFDKVQWGEETTVEEEFQNQFAFFNKISNIDNDKLKKIIRAYLTTIAKNDVLIKNHKGLTATAFWHLKP